MRRYLFLQLLLSSFFLPLTVGPSVFAQMVPAASPTKNEAEFVNLNFGKEVELRVLVDFISQHLKVQILYDEAINNKKISIKAPDKIPTRSLLSLLQSVLKMKGFALVDAEVEGWKRIQRSDKLPAIAHNTTAQKAIDQYGPTTAVTQAFPLQNMSPEQVDKIVSPFLTPQGANTIILKRPPTLIVTDYASNVLKIAQLIEKIDAPLPDGVIKFYPVKHADPASLSGQLSKLIQAKTGDRSHNKITFSHDQRTGQLILVGSQLQVDAALKIVQSLDVPLGQLTRIYTLKNTSAERLEYLAKELLETSDKSSNFKTSVDFDDNLLIVRASPEIHAQIEKLQQSIDRATPQARMPVQFYELKNVTVEEILATLGRLETQGNGPGGGYGSPRRPLPTNGRIRGANDLSLPGANRLPTTSPRNLPKPPAYQETPQNETIRGQGPTPGSSGGAGQLLGQAQVTGDPNTNTLIVIAEPGVQRFYAELIRRLDRRRPQVLIEAKLVIINTSDDFSLGVEVGGGDGVGTRRLFAFSSFGLSGVDAATGALSLIPGTGFNGTLVDPSVADVVVRALASHRRSRVISAPKILVNDNAQGLLTSVDEVPFTSVNASQTVATTSFAGFAEAGTTITVTPHISEGDHIKLEYSITLNTFTGAGSDGIPPPRQTDEVQSEITIPDGHTLIVGGLSRSSKSQTNTGIPFIEKLPLGRYLGGTETRARDTSTLFVFIKPIVLRDDRFEDLKFLSKRDMKGALLPPDMPKSRPLLMK